MSCKHGNLPDSLTIATALLVITLTEASGCDDITSDCTNADALQKICQVRALADFCKRSCGLCPVDGQWGSWEKWGPCSVTCGDGIQNRSRSCDSPAPLKGGKDCAGEGNQTQICSNTPCAVDGQWNEWGTWGRCSATCSWGMHQRQRLCNNPAPSHGGLICSGSSQGHSKCWGGKCPVNGHWSDWSKWSLCSKSCGSGLHFRNRSCNNPSPAHGGSNCSGHSTQSTSCSTASCPACPRNWLHYGSSCYYISRQKVSWPYAEVRCEQLDGWLVEIGSLSENNFIKAHLTPGIDYSIGTKGDTRAHGRYIWNRSHRYVDTGFQDWCDKQPDHWNGENCGVFYRLCNWKWNDEDCQGIRGYVCEKHASR